jgi:hypothetical protein
LTEALVEMFNRRMTWVDEERREHWTIRSYDARLMLTQCIRDN